jgi:hypothetical protein
LSSKKQTKQINVGVDGYQRSKEVDEQISQNVAQLFSSDTGKEVLRYLRAITIDLVHGPNVSTEELRHIEGQRFVIGLLETRINHAHRIKSNG